jgi:RNA polymerase sigma factor (sigma-70 family)
MSRFDSTCWSVVIGAAAGDPAMRDEFCRRYDPVIRSYLAARWRLPREHDAISDATQEVFVQCLREHGALERVDRDREGGMRAFLYGVTARAAGEMERKGARWRRDARGGAIESHDIERSEVTLSAAFDKAWAAMIGREARRLLATRAAAGGEPAKRRFFLLEQRYYQARKPREIAQLVGLDAQRVSEILVEAKAEYRAALIEVMANYFPSDTERELEARCLELAKLL